MQFFPAVLPQGAHFSRPSSTFEVTDSRPGQDFGDLLSSQMDEPKETARAAQSDQYQASSGHERPLSDERDIGDGRSDDDVRGPDQCEGDRNLAETEAVHAEGEGARKDGAETAKAADQGQDSLPATEKEISAAPADGASGGDLHAHPAVRASEAPGSDGLDAEASGEAIVAKIQALLEKLAGEVAAGGLDSGGNGLKAKIEAMHELLRMFRESDPAGRSALAVTLSEQIKAVKAELVAVAQTRAASSKESGQANPGQAASGKMREMDALLERLKARLDLEKGGRGLAGAREEAIVAQTGKAGDAPVAGGERAGRVKISPDAAAALQGTGKAGDADVETGARPGSVKISPDAAAAAQGAGKDSVDSQGTGPSRSASRSGKKSGAGSDIAMRPASGEKAASGSVSAKAAEAGSDGPGGKPGLIPESAENSQGSETRRQEAPLTGAEHKAAQASEQNGRQESAMSRNGLSVAKSRDAQPRDAQQSPTQDAGHRKQEGEAASSVSNRSADFEGGAKQGDARQGFFAASDREKTSSSTLRSAQSAGGEKGALESLTQTAAQNSQTLFQQRLESPASARSAQVYQQVENGAFKNLGQGVKQLVIRLDPADLGQVSVILQVRGKEVQAVLRSSSQEASAALNDQLGQLRTQLEAQGLKVGKLEVQTQLADSQGQSQWQGAQNHNRYQENQELAMSARRWRSLERVAPDLAQDVQISPQREKLSRSGLDIFA